MIHKHSKKKISIVTILLSAFLLLVSSTVVQAAVNPLAKMPNKINTTILGSAGTSFSTPVYPASAQLEIKAVSSNKNVADINGCYVSYNRAESAKNHAKYGWYNLWVKKPGTTKITVTVKLNGKVYKKTCTFTFSKYTNPFKSLKIGKQKLSSSLNKQAYYHLNGTITKATKVSYKLKSNYQIEEAYYLIHDKPGKDAKRQKITSGQNIPSNFISLVFIVKNTKNNVTSAISIGSI